MTALAFILALLSGRVELAVAGVYSMPGDKWDNGALACPNVTAFQVERGFAHRERPCGSTAVVCGRKCAVGFVVDRGPYMSTAGTVERRPNRNRPYRSSLDLRPGLARAAGVRGVEIVTVAWLP